MTKTSKEDLGVVSEQIVNEGAVARSRRNTKTEIGGAGVIGGVLTFLINAFIHDPSIKQPCLYATPLVSTALAVSAVFVGNIVSIEFRYYYGEINRWRKLKRARRGLEAAQADLAQISNNPDVTAADKKAAAKAVADARLIVLNLNVEGILSLN